MKMKKITGTARKKYRKGVLGVIDSTPFSKFKSMSEGRRNILMASAYKAKGKIEKSNSYAIKAYEYYKQENKEKMVEKITRIYAISTLVAKHNKA